MTTLNIGVPADTWILTFDGHQRAADLVDKPFHAVSEGHLRSDYYQKFQAAGANSTFRITTATDWKPPRASPSSSEPVGKFR